MTKNNFHKNLLALTILTSAGMTLVAGAQTTPPAPQNAMVKLEDLLETRASNMGMVPATAANDADFIAFMTAIRSRDTQGRLRPIARAFEVESQTTGLNSYELYQKMKTVLGSVQQSSQTLYGVISALSEGRGQNSAQLNGNLQLGIGRLLRVGFGLGWESRGRWSLPIFTLRAGHIRNTDPSDSFIIGVVADLGMETRKTPNASEIVSFEQEDLTGAAVIVGWTGMSCTADSQQWKYNGLAIGASYHCNSEYKGVQFKLPLFFPLPGLSPTNKARKLEAQLIEALQHFNMTKAASIVEKYKIQVAKAIAFAQRLGINTPTVKLENGHPLSSPGSLFSGSALVAYSPSLAPDLVTLYRPNPKSLKGRNACEQPVIEIEPAPGHNDKGPKQLRE